MDSDHRADRVGDILGSWPFAMITEGDKQGTIAGKDKPGAEMSAGSAGFDFEQVLMSDQFWLCGFKAFEPGANHRRAGATTMLAGEGEIDPAVGREIGVQGYIEQATLALIKGRRRVAHLDFAAVCGVYQPQPAAAFGYQKARGCQEGHAPGVVEAAKRFDPDLSLLRGMHVGCGGGNGRKAKKAKTGNSQAHQVGSGKGWSQDQVYGQ